MRILNVIPTLNPASGGPAEGVLQSSLAMLEGGHDVEVVCLDAPHAPWVKNSPLTVRALGPSPQRYCYNSRLVPWLRNNAARFDTVIVHSLWNYASVGSWQALRRGNTPYLIFTHGMLDPWFNIGRPIKRLLRKSYWRLIQGRILRDAALVLFTTEEECRLAKIDYAGYSYHERIVGYGAATPNGNPAFQVKEFRRSIPTLLDRRFILFLSRIHPKKGCDLLIKAFADVAHCDPTLDIVLAGPDEIGWKSDLQRLAKRLGVDNRIHWPGLLTGDTKWGALIGADAFVLPSHQENFGVAVAEAMACGTPVLITDKVNIWREVKANNAGLVTSDDVYGVTHQLRDFMVLSPDIRDQMRQNARTAFEQHFTVGAASQNLLEAATFVTQRRNTL
jgi:glycosyltransferase involved in cell wall biosynthesis